MVPEKDVDRWRVNVTLDVLTLETAHERGVVLIAAFSEQVQKGVWVRVPDQLSTMEGSVTERVDVTKEPMQLPLFVVTLLQFVPHVGVPTRSHARPIPVGPVEPVAPVAPPAPVKPVGPVEPMGPVSPVGPVPPVGPSSPVGPVGPVAPVRPVGPIGPVGPVGPVG